MGIRTLTPEPEPTNWRRTNEEWTSEASVSSVSLASLSSLSLGSLSTSSGYGNSNPAVYTSTETFITTVTTDGSALASTFTIVTTISSTPTALTTSSTSLPPSSTTSSSVIPMTSVSPTTTATSSTFSPVTPTQFQVGAASQAVCAGHGLDTQAIGVITTLVFSVAVGFIIWLIFAILRPRVRSLYGAREWFVSPGLRPPPLSNGLFAFLHPPVPLVPDLPSDSDVDKAREARINPQPGQANADPAQLFASDEQLAQRTLWVVFLICLAWSLVALVIALPLYLVQTPCLPDSGTHTDYGGRYGTLNDLSVLRLFRMLEDGTLNTSNSTKRAWSYLWKRLIDSNGKDRAPDAYGRLIALCVIIVVIAIIPALWKLWKEFRLLSNYYKLWDLGRCEGIEMGYLSCGSGNSRFFGNRGGAWGWRGWGEGKVKSFFRKAGLGGGSAMGGRDATTSGAGERSALLNPPRSRHRRGESTPGSSDERGDAEINVISVFTVGDTSRLSQLLDERDVILDNLELAEARYINSFQPITPSPSPSMRSTLPLPPVAEDSTAPTTDVEKGEEAHPGFLAALTRRRTGSRPTSSITSSSDQKRDLKSQISRPRPLKGSYSRSRRGYTPVMTGPTYPPTISQTPYNATKGKKPVRQDSGDTDKTPTTYLAPSQYYKLKNVKGVSGGKMGSEEFQTVGRSQEPAAAAAKAPGFARSLKDRLAGSRFFEVNRDSTLLGKIPMGSKMVVDEHGVLNPVEMSHGPNHGAQGADDDIQIDGHERGQNTSSTLDPTADDNELVLIRDASGIPEDPQANPSSTRARPRPPKSSGYDPASRDTFPMRSNTKRGAALEEQPPHLRLQAQQPFHRPISGLDHDALGAIYANIRHWRSALKAINNDIAEEQEKGFENIAQGEGVKGWILVGKGLRYLPGVELIEGRSKEDVRWEELQRGGGFWSDVAFWFAVCVIGLLLACGLLAAAGLALATMPDVVHYLPFLSPVVRHNNIQSGIATGLAPAVAASLFIWLAIFAIHRAAHHSGAVSVTAVRIKTFKAVFWVIVIVAGIWLVTVGSLVFGARSLDQGSGETTTVGDGSIATAEFLLLIIINVAIIVPGLLLLQPVHLWRQHRRQKKAITPRQQFRAIYPRVYNPVYALGCCILGIVFIAAFALLFPLIGPAVVLLLLLTLIAHRYLIGYVFGRTDSSQTGGILQLWVMRRFATLFALQPLLIGLILLAHKKWILGGIMIGISIFLVILVEWYCTHRLKKPSVESLSPVTRDSIEQYIHSARPANPLFGNGSPDEKGSAAVPSQGKGRRTKNGSISSVLEMMSITLAVMPGNNRNRPPVPLPTEHLDDLIATERAARTHPDAPPHLPPLAFVDHAEEMAGILYPPELTAPPPVIWLPNDSAGIARSEAYDLQHYHRLTATIDVRSTTDVPEPRKSAEDRRGPKAR